MSISEALLFSAKMFGIKLVRYPAFIISLVHIFDYYIQNVMYKISADILDIGIVLFPNIGIGISPKNTVLVGPYFCRHLLITSTAFSLLDPSLKKYK